MHVKSIFLRNHAKDKKLYITYIIKIEIESKYINKKKKYTGILYIFYCRYLNNAILSVEVT